MIFSYQALSVTVELLPIIVLALETMTTMTDTSGQAQSLLNNITSSKFIVTITLTSIIIDTTKELCKKLQGVTNVRAKTHQQFRRSPTMYEVWGGWLAFIYSMVSGYLKLGSAYMNYWHKFLCLVDVKQSWISCTLLINFYRNLHWPLGRSLDIALSNTEVGVVKQKISTYRSSVDVYHDIWYAQCQELAEQLGVEITMPRRCARQSMRSNTPSADARDYFRRVITVPVLGMMLEILRRLKNNKFIIVCVLHWAFSCNHWIYES